MIDWNCLSEFPLGKLALKWLQLRQIAFVLMEISYMSLREIYVENCFWCIVCETILKLHFVLMGAICLG